MEAEVRIDDLGEGRFVAMTGLGGPQKPGLSQAGHSLASLEGVEVAAGDCSLH